MPIIRKSILSTVGAGVAASLLLVSGLAEAQQRSNTARGFELAAPQGPQPGDCKQHYVSGVGLAPQVAQANWSQNAAAAYGNNWAIWVGSKNQSMTATPAGNGPQQFTVMAQPCFYHPVP